MRQNVYDPEDLNDAFHYDTVNGKLYWSHHLLVPARKRGCLATKQYDEHLSVNIHGQQIPAHRIIWAITRERWPEDRIYHRNGDKADNRAANLTTYKEDRPEASQAERLNRIRANMTPEQLKRLEPEPAPQPAPESTGPALWDSLADHPAHKAYLRLRNDTDPGW